MRFRHAFGSLVLATLLPLAIVACSSSSSDGTSSGGTPEGGTPPGTTPEGGVGNNDGGPGIDSATPGTGCKLTGLTGVADVTPTFVFNEASTAPPAMTGGTLKGKYTVDKATAYLPAATKGVADPAKSTGTVNAWAVFDGTSYLIKLKVDFSIAITGGAPQAQASDVTSQGGFTTATAALTLDHACDTKPADEASYTFTDTGGGRAQILIKTSTPFGDSFLLLDAAKQ